MSALNQTHRIKLAIFWSILIVIALGLVEFPFRVYERMRDAQFERAQVSLSLASDTEISSYLSSGRIGEYLDEPTRQRAVTDVINLNRGGYIEYPNAALLAPRRPYFTFRLNAMGFRGPEWIRLKDPREIRVFILGGSTAFSFLAEEEQSIHYQLERMLNERIGATDRYVRVYNAAVPAMNTFGEREILRRFVLLFQPDIVVAIHGYNDAVIEKVPKKNGDVISVVSRLFASAPLHSWVRRSAALRVISEPVSAWVRSQASFFTPVGSLTPDETERVYADNVDAMRALLETRGIQYLVYRQPTPLAAGGKALTAKERGLMTGWATTHQSFYKNFLDAYPRFLQHLRDKGFHVIDGQERMAAGLPTRRIPSGATTTLHEPTGSFIPVRQVRLGRDKEGVARTGTLSFFARDGKNVLTVPHLFLCERSDVMVGSDGFMRSLCEIGTGAAVLARADRSTSWSLGYAGVAHPTGKGDLIIRFVSPTPIATGILELYLPNYRDKEPTIATMSLSTDGTSYDTIGSRRVSYDAPRDARWEWSSSTGASRELFVRIHLSRVDNLIGVSGMRITLQGSRAGGLWDDDSSPTTVANTTDSDVVVESFATVGGDPLYVDTAHLTARGYAAVAEQIAEFIEEKKWLRQ